MTNTLTPSATTPVTGLQTKAMIVNVNIRAWSGRALDRKITREVNQQHNADSDAGRYNKALVNKKYIEPLTKKAGEARNYHYENTLPWGDNGDRLLPSANFMEYTTKMNNFKIEYQQLATDFISQLWEIKEDAKIRLNGMYNEKDYPTALDLQTMFGMKIEFMPLPETDFRIDLTETELANLTKSVENSFRERTAAAMADIWDRIKKQLEHMKERLTTVNTNKDGTQSPAKFHDTLFENLADIIALIPKLNVTEDANLNQICEELKPLLKDPDNVRGSAMLRSRTAQEVTNVLAKFEDFFG